MTVVTTNEIGTIKIEIVKNCYNELRKKEEEEKSNLAKSKLVQSRLEKVKNYYGQLKTQEKKKKSQFWRNKNWYRQD